MRGQKEGWVDGISGLWMLLLDKWLDIDFLVSIWVESFIHPPVIFFRFFFSSTAEFQKFRFRG